jgi:hypothetical protein
MSLAKRGAAKLMTPLILYRPESIGKDRKFGEHCGEPLDQRQQAQLRHGGNELVLSQIFA